jgi:hypothetical protein
MAPRAASYRTIEVIDTSKEKLYIVPLSSRLVRRLYSRILTSTSPTKGDLKMAEDIIKGDTYEPEKRKKSSGAKKAAAKKTAKKAAAKKATKKRTGKK